MHTVKKKNSNAAFQTIVIVLSKFKFRYKMDNIT